MLNDSEPYKEWNNIFRMQGFKIDENSLSVYDAAELGEIWHIDSYKDNCQNDQ